jgi:hypothetical protein
MDRNQVDALTKKAKELNQAIDIQSDLDFNQLVSYLYRKGLIKALSTKNAKYGQILELEKRSSKLETKFTGFKVSGNTEEDSYTNLTFFKDIELIGEMLGYQFSSGSFDKRYAQLNGFDFPLYFGWYSPSVTVYMKAEPTAHEVMVGTDVCQALVNLPPIPGKPSEFKIEDEELASQLDSSMLIYFAEGAMPRDTQLNSIQALVDKIGQSLGKRKAQPAEVS